MADNTKLATAELLYNCAVHMGLRPMWLKQDSLFSIATPFGERYIYHAKSTVNSHLGSSLARHKVMTRLVLERHELPNIPYLKTSDMAEALQFLAMYSKIIVKPTTGSNSHDVRIVTAPEQLADLDIRKYILEQHITGKEVRYLILNGRVIGVHESQYGESVDEERPLKRISYPESTWDIDLVALAIKTADVVGLRFAAVDYLITPSGQVYILEVNSSPGMKWFHAPTSGPVVEVARLFLEAMLDDMRPKTALVPDLLVTHPTVAYS